MSAAVAALPAPIAAFLAGRPIPWREVGLSAEVVRRICCEQQVSALLYDRLQRAPLEWPASIGDGVASIVRADAARESVRRREIAAVLDAFAHRGIHPILIKGTPLAYTIYPTPAARPRGDTDALLPREQMDGAREILSEAGYTAAVYCEGEVLFRQIEMQKTDRFGIVHAWDLHWGISTQAVFADLLSYDELARDAAPVDALGAHAWAASPIHALLLACVHPAMHHRNEANVLWTLDVHLLVSRMTPAELTAFARLAATRRVAAIVLAQLEEAARLWGTGLPPEPIATLRRAAAGREPSSEYLQPGRRWRHELAANLRYLPGWRSRLQLLREIAFPSSTYMTRAYGIPASGPATALLPGLYLARLIAGAGKLLIGRKS